MLTRLMAYVQELLDPLVPPHDAPTRHAGPVAPPARDRATRWRIARRQEAADASISAVPWSGPLRGTRRVRGHAHRSCKPSGTRRRAGHVDESAARSTGTPRTRRRLRARLAGSLPRGRAREARRQSRRLRRSVPWAAPPPPVRRRRHGGHPRSRVIPPASARSADGRSRCRH